MPTDLLLDNDFDLITQNGDFVVGDTTRQHQGLLFISQPGEWRQYPLVGVGAKDFLNDDRVAEMATEIQKQFEADGMVVTKVTVKEEGQTSWDAKYNY